MKFLFDLLPVFLFFISFKWAEGHKALAADLMNRHLGFLVSGGVVSQTEAAMLLATVILVACTLIQILILKAMRKPVDKMLWAGAAIGVVLGGLTLWFHNEMFIKWKPTIFYWAGSIALLVSEVVMKRDVLFQAMGGQVHAPEHVWRKLTWAWVIFLFALGVLNLLVAFNPNISTDTWVTLKLWGVLGLMLVFGAAQAVYLSKHMHDAPVAGVDP